MSDVEKLTIKIAAEFMVARINKGPSITFEAQLCARLAKTIINEVLK